MSYVIKAVLSNARHPEHGQVTVPFPISEKEYDRTMEELGALEIGNTLNQDSQVDDLDSFYSVLKRLEGSNVTLDELDYLAKRLDSFGEEESAQFQGMAHKLGLNDIRDFINLTFCCRQATVITDFSNLEAVGRSHFLNLNGSGAKMEELENLDGAETALLLIDGGGEAVTPYGVVYDNGMKLEQLYNGRQFPGYLYGDCIMGVEVKVKCAQSEGQIPELLCLSTSEKQIERMLLRAGVEDPNDISDVEMSLEYDTLPTQITEMLDMRCESPGTLNALCHAIAGLSETEQKKLGAVVLMAGPCCADEVRELAENLEQFDFVPNIQTSEEYGRYMIRESGHFEYDENLESFYDYRRYGEQQVRQEGGQFNECGYVAYHGTMTLEELMRVDPAEMYRLEQGPQMGGQSW